MGDLEQRGSAVRHGRRAVRRLLLTALLLVVGHTAAHATLIIGELTFNPDPPMPGEGVEVSISLKDPLQVPTRKAVVRVELRAIVPGEPEAPASATGTEAVEFLALPHILSTDPLEEVDRGVYSATIAVPEGGGSYTLSVRDTTFWNEEAIANLPLEFGGPRLGAVDFVLPPTPIAPKSLTTWLIWILGVPIAAGLVVTFVVLRRGPESEEEAEEGEAVADDTFGSTEE